MTKEECENRITDLFEPEGLLVEIREGTLNTQKLDELAQAVGTLNALELDPIYRSRLAAILWEFAFHVSSCVCWHVDPNDAFSFENASGRQFKALKNMVYWLSNRFTYAKDLDPSELDFAGYMRWDGLDPTESFDLGKSN